jgi:FtsH-binding integral membrane protein
MNPNTFNQNVPKYAQTSQNTNLTSAFPPNMNNYYPNQMNPNNQLQYNQYQNTNDHAYNQGAHGESRNPVPNQNQNNFYAQNAINMNHNTQGMMMNQMRNENSHEDEGHQLADFSDKKLRLGFIKKTFAILALMLLITCIFVLIPLVSLDVRVWMINNWWLSIVTSVLAMIIMYVVIYTKAGRKVPINYILIFAFAVLESYTVAFVAARYEPSTVALAAGLTTVMVISLSLYAACTKTDFTKCGGFLMICLVVLISGGIVAFFFRNKILNLILSVLGVIIFGIYLIFDIQLLLGNKKNKFSKDDYVLAAMMLYIDIIQIFLYLLQIIGSARS